MAKSAEAFRTISEVADDLDIPKYVLRFWEDRFPQIRPMKRGGGRRYYRPEDMELLRGIRQLLRSDGYTIKGVQRILREQGVDHVKQFGRDPASEPPPVVEVPPPAVRGRSKKSPSATGLAADQAAAAPRREAPASAVPTLRETIERAIAELEACRALLVTPPPANDQARTGRRARSGL